MGSRWDEVWIICALVSTLIFQLSTQDDTAISGFTFTQPVYNVTIPENSAGRAFVTSTTKMGIFRGNDDIEVRYKIVSGDKDKFFKAEERLVGDFWFLLIRTRTGNTGVLNRERKDKYVLDIKATATKRDNRQAFFSEAETKVIVNVLDVNDLGPLFYPTEYEEIIPEDAPVHRSILRVSAEDADLGRNGEIYYSFKEKTEQFAIHPTTGVVTLTRPLKYSEKSLHELTVLGQDRGPPNKGRGNIASSAKLRIIVKKVNLYAPEIYVRHLPSIVENSFSPTYAIVKIIDRDEGPHGQIKSLDIVDGDPDGHFRIRPANTKLEQGVEYNIEVLKLIDRENTPHGYNLTLRAVDRGIPPKQTYKSIPVHLADLNDNAPIFDREIYEVDVPETAPVNSPIIRLKVTDADIGKNSLVLLEIVGGNEGEEFHINPDTGMLYTNTKLDAELKSFYTLTVTAIDQGNTGMRKQSSAKVKINVVDANDNDPLFEPGDIEVDIPENDPPGTSVIKVVAKDRDSGENSYISYSIANLNPVPFEIDHFTGVIRTTVVLDYETMKKEHILRVRASDWGLPYRRQTEMQLKIRITNINDNRPIFEKIDCTGHISRSTLIGSEIFTFSAIDFDTGNMITYSIVSGNEDACFSLDSTSGILSVACDLADVLVTERTVNVTASDGTHYADVNKLHIKLVKEKEAGTGRLILDDTGIFECKETGVARKLREIFTTSDKNNSPNYKEHEAFAMMPSRYLENVHTPEFIDFPNSLSINESKILGNTVLKIKARDRDRGYNGKLVFGISSGDDDSVFRLDPDSGDLKVIGYLDRERRSEYILNITVYDLGKPQKSFSKILPVVILDVNDNPPRFKTSVASFKVSENAHNGTVVYKVSATDLDEGDFANIRYSLVTDTKDFAVDPFSGVLYVSAPLDRETQEVYELVVRATDCGGDNMDPNALHSDAIIRVIVDDVNDNWPSFPLQSYSVKVREDVPLGSVVAVLSATDPDLGAGGQIVYSIKGETELDNAFSIDELTGTIRLSNPLNFEERQVHSLTVRAADKGTPSLSKEVNLIVEVVDVNENMFPPVFDDFVKNASVKENQPIGTDVVKVTAKDADPPGDDSTIGYSIKGGDGLGYFSIDNEGVIRTLTILDAESKAHYWLTVMAFDHGSIPLHSSLEVFISVVNINDNVPLTVEPVYYPKIPENSPIKTPVVQLMAWDADLESSQSISYRITSGNPQNFFTINQHTGLISTTGRKLDRENQSEHILEVTVSDDGDPPLSSTTRVIVQVEDVNDNAPTFDSPFYHIKIPESNVDSSQYQMSSESELEPLSNGTWESFPENATGEFLFAIVAQDLDEGKNAQVRYEILSGRGKGKFAIHPTTGAVFSNKTFLTGQEYDFTIRATDGGSPNMSSTCRVLIQVVAVNRGNQPLTKPQDQHVQIHESENVGFLVVLLSEGIDEFVWYRITDGDPHSVFYIKNDGSILLAKKLDWEKQKQYNLTISISDGVNTVFTKVFVTVVNINEHRPVFSQSSYSVNVSESLPVGSELLTVQAVDQDFDSKVQYSLHSAQNPSSLYAFKINHITGTITVAQPLDRESISEHVLTVMAKDQGTSAKRNYVRVTCKVHDANDHAPEFSTSFIQGRVYETSAVGTIFLNTAAVDKDHGENAMITYSITSGNVGNAFYLDPLLGTISVARELDMNLMSEYMLMVKATDKGTPPLSSTIAVHILVVMADNAPPRFTTREATAELFENEPAGLPVKHLEARSTSSLLYEIVRGNVDNAFDVNPTTGVLFTNVPLDYEKVKTYNLSVTATNMAGSKAVCHVAVHVLDRNDNAPAFHQTSYTGWISEAAPVASLVLANQSMPLVVRAYDNDSQPNALLQYNIVESAYRRMFHIDSTTGAIRTVVALDYETFSSIEFHVRLTDLGEPRLSSETLAKVTINILDANDCAPVFSQTEYNASVLVPTYSNVMVIQLNATDKDSVALTKLAYTIISGNSEGVYTLESDTGVIRVVDVQRGARTSPHRLRVSVSDGQFTSETFVNIKWLRSQDSGLMFQRTFYQGLVTENSTKIVTVAVVSVLGNHLNEHIVFSILNPTPLFTIGETSGALRTTGQRFDREEQEFFELIIQAQSLEDSRGQRVTHVPVNVTVLDINDNCPMFVNLPYYAVVSIDAHKGDVITKVHAVDLDKGENGEVRYELIRGNGELFKVSRKTGEVSLKQALEGHNREYQLIVAAYDGGGTPCSTEVVVNVKVMDRSMPVFDKQFYTLTTPENVELFSPLAVKIQADSPLNRKLIYSISRGNNNEQFGIDFNTGALHVVDDLDYEKQQEYALTVRATDSVSGVSAEVLVSILVTDVNDCPPEFPVDTYNVSISEASPFGSVVLKVSARDNDTGLNGKVSYLLDSSNNASYYFHIDPEDGSVYLTRPLDHEVQSMHHIVIVATDYGVPSLSSSVHVWIRVLDMNDNPPKLEQTVYTAWLSEEATRGQFVTIVSASDPDVVDQEHLSYSIVGGNQQHIFSMDSSTGVIRVANLRKLGDSQSHTLNVSVSDGVYTSFARVRIEIVPANKHSPVFDKHLYESKVLENAPSGARVVKVYAPDKDSGLYGKVTYSIMSQVMLDKFRINNITGELYTRKSLDREKQKMYEIPVMARDYGGRAGFTLVRAWITDVNDNQPKFVLPEYKACIYSNLSTETGFLKVKAIDEDEGSYGQIEYSINDKNLGGVNELFEINPQTGGLSLKKKAHLYENQVFQFFIRATDKGVPSTHSEVAVDVYIMSKRDSPPIFERRDDKVFVTESAAPGTVITQVKLLNEVPVKYKLISNSDKLFSIDRNGQISLVGKLDREKSPHHLLGVLALTDSSPPLTALTEIFLQVLDHNDNKPEFDSDLYKISVSENLEEGSPVIRVHATDADDGKNGEVRYSIIGEGGDVFNVDSHTGWVTTLTTLDREVVQTYTVVITATDGGLPSLSSNTTLHISLIDYNDNPSQFLEGTYLASVNEDALPGTVVVQVSVTDLDSDPTNIVYHIKSGDPHSQFAVRSTGEVYVTRSLDRESIDRYLLTLVATDGKFVSEATLQIDILDSNDQPPYCLRYRYKETVSEGVSVGTYILTVLAIDRDLNPKLKFYLTGDGSEHFHLDRTSGDLRTASVLDRERLPVYKLKAHVQDREHASWECFSLIIITLTDINDNIPTFSSKYFTAVISEDAPIGSLVTKMHATDSDIGMNRRVKYFLADSANGHFIISSDNGIVSLAKGLDREIQDTYNVTVKAIDQGYPQLWSQTLLTIMVADVNDNPPEFVSRSYHSVVPENAILDTEVARVMATSLDTGVNAEIEYSIIGGNEHEKFAIDPQTGVIRIVQLLDYERASDYILTIQATDLGVPPLSNQATVNITVLDSNDNEPVFNRNSYAAKVKEDCEIGEIILQVSASDLDSGMNGKIVYSIERGDKHQQFVIDPDNGYISVARPLDREMISNYVLHIKATDSGMPEMSSYAVVNIEVSDANDNPPIFTQANYTVIVQEDKRPGWTVCQLLVTDADVAPNTGPFTFDLRSEDGLSSFKIEPDGTIRTAALLNHKLQDTYLLHVRVIDNGTPSLYSDTWVIVKVIEESQFPPLVTPLEIWVGSYQERWLGGELGRVHASDKDQYDTLSYAIANTSSSVKGLFKIDPRHGVITAGPGLDSGVYRLNVSVSDDKFTTFGNVRITVEPIWDEMLLHSISIKVPSVTPHSFILTQRKTLIKTLKNLFLKEVSVISVQDAGYGDVDVLLWFREGMDIETFNGAIKESNIPIKPLDCNCLNGAICRQRINLESNRVYTISTDVVSLVTPAHSNDLYCACSIGYSGDHCEELLPPTKCECPPSQTCVPQPSPPGFVCAPPSPASPLCSLNHTCTPYNSSFPYQLDSIPWIYVVYVGLALIFLCFVCCCFCLLCRKCRRSRDNDPVGKVNTVMNPDVKRSSKVSNLAVTQVIQRPTSYPTGTIHEVPTGGLNNLDTVRSYGSAGDDLETVPPDYVKNLNPGHKINNDLKRLPDIQRRSLGNEEETRLPAGGAYHWDCSDWVKPTDNPLPNITEVPGSEVPDSSSFNSNDSNTDLSAQIHPADDPARELATLDEQLHYSYRSDDDDFNGIIRQYGFPKYASHSDISNKLCDIEDLEGQT